jgi:hypothetical protein
MKKKLRFPFLLAGTMFITTFAASQSPTNTQNEPDRFAYTVTDSVQNGIKWNFLRKINLRTGSFSNVLVRLLNRNDTVSNSLLCNGVAAIALDDKNNRLYYTPMLIDRLSYVDLRTMRKHLVTNSFTGMDQKAADQSNIITRMVIAEDGNGYALTNDGNHLIRFNTRNHRIKDLGCLIDARHNEVSVHEICSSYGGDIISGDEGILYLITSRNHVFKINIETKIAKYLGTITGVPENFTTSGAAVDYRNNRFVIGSSINTPDIYSVNIRSLVASSLGSPNPWNLSDLANSNSLGRNNEHLDAPEIFVSAGNLNNDKIKLYPNPVTANEFKIQFANTDTRSYTVDVIDVLGQVIITRVVNTVGKNNVVNINLPESTNKGILIVRITDEKSKAIFSEKIILQ